MTLTTEARGEFSGIDATALDEMLRSEEFGEFAILSVAEHSYIQTANCWQPGERCRQFIETNNSDPWVLEYHEGDQHFQVEESVTLEQVRLAFGSYLSGEGEWKRQLSWSPLRV